MKTFILKIIWLNDSIGIAIDHVLQKGYSPLSSYFFWPRNDAWTQIKKELESKPWISENDKIELLNEATIIINYWQEHKTLQSAKQIQAEFPNIIFCMEF